MLYQKGQLNLERRSDEGGEFDIQVIPAGQIHVCGKFRCFCSEREMARPSYLASMQLLVEEEGRVAGSLKE